MENKKNKTSFEFDYNCIKESLNTSLEEEGITVSDDLINQTMIGVQKSKVLDFKSDKDRESGGKSFLSKFRTSNIALAVFLFLILGLGILKHSSNFNIANKSAPKERAEKYDLYASQAGMEAAPKEDLGQSYDQDTDNSIIEEEEISTASSLSKFSNIIGLDPEDIDAIEISYYVDNSVINKDLMEKEEEIIRLLDSYQLIEEEADEDHSWSYRLTIVPKESKEDSSKAYSQPADIYYIILIGNHLDIIKKSKLPTKKEDGEENEELDRKSYEIKDLEELIQELDRLILN
mgnify:CR=1 FL=1